MISRYESDRTFKEKKELEKQKLSQMKFREKLEYIWTYYKPLIFGVIGVIAAVFIILDLVENAKYYDILSIAVSNASMIDSVTPVEEQLKEELGTGDEYETVSIDASYSFGYDMENIDYNTLMKFNAVVAAKSLDVLICGEEIHDNFESQEFFMTLGEVLGEETCEKYGIDPADTKLEITNLPRYQEMELTYYEPVYLTVLINTENVEHVKDFILYLEEDNEK
ncbi:MAG: hypothetical protein SOT28_07560 [Fusicatenibacter sp.]|nr:hypothetical protein [Lachnospiraceae bacterium]MDY2938146.1 hypothetical protein [Fusicatenibacter sp.]